MKTPSEWLDGWTLYYKARTSGKKVIRPADIRRIQLTYITKIINQSRKSKQ